MPGPVLKCDLASGYTRLHHSMYIGGWMIATRTIDMTEHHETRHESGSQKCETMQNPCWCNMVAIKCWLVQL